MGSSVGDADRGLAPLKSARRMNAGVTLLAPLLLLLAVGCARSPDEGRVAQASESPNDPIYYVDGARPDPNVNDGRELPDVEYLQGCVQWSSERPDVYICETVPESYRPAPAPGGYADYSAVCDAAAQVFAAHAAQLVEIRGLPTLPIIDIMSCGAAGLGTAQEKRWIVKFALANAQDVLPYRSVIIQGLVFGDVVSDKGPPVLVRLSGAPWPI
jgi:hypothetical protein